MKKTRKDNKLKPQDPIKREKQDNNDLEVAKKMLKINQSAIDRNLEFNLKFESVKKLMSYSTCYYTDRKFESDGNYSRSFDRIDTSKGYVEGNVVACTIDINGKKSNLSLDEIECLYKKLILKRKEEKREVPDKNEDPASPEN